MQNRLNMAGGVILCLGLILAGCSKKADQDSQSSRQFLGLGTAVAGRVEGLDA